MSCNICLEDGETISICTCNFRAHESCFSVWYSQIDYGRIISKKRLSCPMCGKYGINRFIRINLDPNFDIDKMDDDHIYIICACCKCIKQFEKITCSEYPNDTYRLVCPDCQRKEYKRCPGCDVLCERIAGCNHIKCTLCDCDWCWLCGVKCDRADIYNHIHRKHMNVIENNLTYDEYYEMAKSRVTRLEDIPDIYHTEELLVEIIKNHPKYIGRIHQTRRLCLIAVSRNGMVLSSIRDRDREICLTAVQNNGLALMHIEDQDDELCKEAVKNIEGAIVHVKNKTYDLCLEVIRKKGHYLKYVPFRDEVMCMVAVKSYGQAIEYIDDPSEDICYAAIDDDPHALFHIQNQTEDMCLRAVQKIGMCLQYVKKQTKRICLDAVKESGFALQFVNEDLKDEEICYAAVSRNGSALKYITNPSRDIMIKAAEKMDSYITEIDDREIVLISLKYRGYLLKYIENQDKEMCLIAVSSSPYAYLDAKIQDTDIKLAALRRSGNILEFIKDQTLEICQEAVKQNSFAIKYVNPEFRHHFVK